MMNFTAYANTYSFLISILRPSGLILGFAFLTGVALAEPLDTTVELDSDDVDSMSFDLVIVKTDGEFRSMSVSIGSGDEVHLDSGYIDNVGGLLEVPEHLPEDAEVIGSHSSVVVFGQP